MWRRRALRSQDTEPRLILVHIDTYKPSAKRSDLVRLVLHAHNEWHRRLHFVRRAVCEQHVTGVRHGDELMSLQCSEKARKRAPVHIACHRQHTTTAGAVNMTYTVSMKG